MEASADNVKYRLHFDSNLQNFSIFYIMTQNIFSVSKSATFVRFWFFLGKDENDT